MEILSRLSKAWGFACLISLSFSGHTDPLTNIVLSPGFQTDVVYVDCLSTNQDQQVWDLAIDPLEGDIYIARAPQVENADGEKEIQANILVVTPQSVESHDFVDAAACQLQADSREQSIIDFPSQALDFAPDGTMYFGVSTLMLGVWQRETNVFRKFTTIPNIRAVDVTPSGELYVSSNTKGVTPLHPDTILSVDRDDAFFEPVFQTSNAESALGKQFEVVTGIAITPDGSFYASYFPGEMVRKDSQGSFTEVNNRNGKGEIGGVNEAGLNAGPNGAVFQFDATSGRLFAILPNGEVKLVAYGSDLQSSTFSQVAIDSDGNRLMFMLENGRLVELTTTDGSSLLSKLQADAGQGSLQGVVETPAGSPLSGITVILQNGAETLTDASGGFSFSNVAAGFHEVFISNPEYRPFLQIVEVVSDENLDLGSIQLVSFLPANLAPGLQAEVVDPAETDISGSSDVWVDDAGNVFSMNFSVGTVTRTSRDGDGNETTFTVARGGGLNNSFTMAVDSTGSVYASSGNDGVLQLPLAETTYELVTNSNDSTIVTDQNGVNRMISLVRDVDGIGVLTDDTLVLSSGDGGEASPNFPNGTFNSLVLRSTSGAESIWSRGTPVGGGSSVFQNNDNIQMGPNDELLVADKDGDLMLLDPPPSNSDGEVQVIWPGSPDDGRLSIGGFANIGMDPNGNVFARGTVEGDKKFFAIVQAPDGSGTELVYIAEGINFSFGGFAFESSSSVVIGDDKLIRISTIDGSPLWDSLLGTVSTNSGQGQTTMQTVESKGQAGSWSLGLLLLLLISAIGFNRTAKR